MATDEESRLLRIKISDLVAFDGEGDPSYLVHLSPVF